MTLIREIDFGTPASRADTMVNLTIDGEPVTVPAGTGPKGLPLGVQHHALCC